MLLYHVASRHLDLMPPDLARWLKSWSESDKSARQKADRTYQAKRVAPDAPAQVTTTSHALPDLPVDYDVKAVSSAYPPPTTTAAIRELLAPSRTWTGGSEYTLPTASNHDPVRAQLGARLAELNARIPSSLISDGIINIDESVFTQIEGNVMEWGVLDAEMNADNVSLDS